jgi:hypothetical protein
MVDTSTKETRVIFVTGMSGGGKSFAVKELKKLGFKTLKSNCCISLSLEDIEGSEKKNLVYKRRPRRANSAISVWKDPANDPDTLFKNQEYEQLQELIDSGYYNQANIKLENLEKADHFYIFWNDKEFEQATNNPFAAVVEFAGAKRAYILDPIELAKLGGKIFFEVGYNTVLELSTIARNLGFPAHITVIDTNTELARLQLLERGESDLLGRLKVNDQITKDLTDPNSTLKQAISIANSSHVSYGDRRNHKDTKELQVLTIPQSESDKKEKLPYLEKRDKTFDSIDQQIALVVTMLIKAGYTELAEMNYRAEYALITQFANEAAQVSYKEHEDRYFEFALSLN